METERERNRRLYPEMAAIVAACSGSVTAAAIFEDGEVVSGRMPANDYKLCDVSADGWLAARNRIHELPKAAKMPAKDKRK